MSLHGSWTSAVLSAALLTVTGSTRPALGQAAPGAQQPPPSDMPMTYCSSIAPRAGHASVSTLRAAMPGGAIRPGADRFSSVALAPGRRLVALDANSSSVYVLDAAGKEQERWGTTGSAPGQLSSPVAMAVGQDTTVYVLEMDGRIDVFSISGRPLRSFSTGFAGGTGIAVTERGTIGLVRRVDAVRISAGGTFTYAVEVSTSGATLHTLRSATPAAVRQRPLLAPVLNEVGIVAGPGNRLAVYYKYDPTVVVFIGGRAVTTAVGCLADELVQFYRKERASANVTMSTGVAQLHGVFIAKDGSVIMHGGVTDASGRYSRILRYASNGTPMLVVDFHDAPPNTLFTNSTLASESQLYSWGARFGTGLTEWQLITSGR